MKNTSLRILLVLMTVLVMMSGCGSTSSNSSMTTAVVVLSTTGTLPAGTKIGGIQVKVNLPSGVTARASLYSAGSSTMVTDAGVITASGSAAGSYTSGVYQAGSTTATYAINMDVVNASGFSTGEFAQVSCDIAAGSSPTAAGFSLSNFEAVDLNGVPLTGITPGFTVAFQ